jgi:quercetin dioxygenase-like cupin family protein
MHPNANGHVLLGADAGEVIEVRGNRVVIKVASPSQLVGEYSAPAGFAGPPLHVHPGFDESFHVLDGQLEVTIRDQVRELTPGMAAFVSGNVPHTFGTADREAARFLFVCSPGGFEHYFRALASGDTETMAAISERFGYRSVA